MTASHGLVTDFSQFEPMLMPGFAEQDGKREPMVKLDLKLRFPEPLWLYSRLYQHGSVLPTQSAESGGAGKHLLGFERHGPVFGIHDELRRVLRQVQLAQLKPDAG